VQHVRITDFLLQFQMFAVLYTVLLVTDYRHAMERSGELERVKNDVDIFSKCIFDPSVKNS